MNNYMWGFFLFCFILSCLYKSCSVQVPVNDLFLHKRQHVLDADSTLFDQWESRIRQHCRGNPHTTPQDWTKRCLGSNAVGLMFGSLFKVWFWRQALSVTVTVRYLGFVFFFLSLFFFQNLCKCQSTHDFLVLLDRRNHNWVLVFYLKTGKHQSTVHLKR